MVLTEKQQNYQHYHLEKLINNEYLKYLKYLDKDHTFLIKKMN